MPAPMRPSPTSPIFMLPPLGLSACQRLERVHTVTFDVYVSDPAASGQKRLQVAECLRITQSIESVGGAGNRRVSNGIIRNQNEHPGVWSALVELSRGVQVARAKSEHSRHQVAIMQHEAQGLEFLLQRGVTWQIGEY